MPMISFFTVLPPVLISSIGTTITSFLHADRRTDKDIITYEQTDIRTLLIDIITYEHIVMLGIVVIMLICLLILFVC